MKQVLFVDDEPNVLRGLQRMLHPLRREWEMTFVESADEALGVLAEQPVDVVVTDMRMEGSDGADLLTEVARRHPEVVRIVLSGQCDEEMVLRLVGVTHQYLAKPCDAERLRATVGRACALRDLLTEERVKRLIAEMPSLPSLPAVYAELMEELRSPDASVARVGRILGRDVGMTAKILQLVNSAFFGLPSRITQVERAVSLLGLRTIKALVLSVGVFSQYEQTQVRAFHIEAIMHHSLAVGTSAQLIAREERQPRQRVDDAFLAGVMHDVGKLVLAASLPERYAEVLAHAHAGGTEFSRTPAPKAAPPAPASEPLRGATARAAETSTRLWEAEQAVFGAGHAEVGAYLLGLWGLPENVVEAVAFHHRPAASPHDEFCPLTAVHVADFLEHAADESPRATGGQAASGASAPEVLAEYLATLGLTGRFGPWAEACEGARREWSAA